MELLHQLKVLEVLVVSKKPHRILLISKFSRPMKDKEKNLNQPLCKMRLLINQDVKVLLIRLLQSYSHQVELILVAHPIMIVHNNLPQDKAEELVK